MNSRPLSKRSSGRAREKTSPDGQRRERIRDGNTTWLARWRDPDGRQRKKTFARKTDANRFLATVEADKLRGTYVDHSDRTTVAEYARQWADARPHRSSTARRVSSLIETHIAGTRLGNRRLAAVLPSEVQAWATDRAAVLSPSTLRNLVSLLRSIYASAVLDRLVGSSPVVRITLPRHERERVVPLTVEQVRALADAMPDRNRAMVLVQAGLGLRIGELLALRAQDVDFLRRSARIEWQIAPGAKVRSEPKTPRSRRTVPLPQIVADALAAHMATFPPVLTEPCSPRTRERHTGTTTTGRSSSPQRYAARGSPQARRLTTCVTTTRACS